MPKVACKNKLKDKRGHIIVIIAIIEYLSFGNESIP